MAVKSLQEDRDKRVAVVAELMTKLDTLTPLVGQVSELNKILSTGRSGLDLLYLAAKIMGAFTVISGGLAALLYIIRSFPLK